MNIIKKERHKILTAVYAVIIKDNKILLSLRNNSGFMDNWYSLVAGHVEANETIDEAMKRELNEEANIIVESLNLATVMCRLGKEGRDDYLDFFFIINDYKGEIKNNEPEKCSDLRFFNINDMLINTIDYVTKAINNVLIGKTYDNF